MPVPCHVSCFYPGPVHGGLRAVYKQAYLWRSRLDSHEKEFPQRVMETKKMRSTIVHEVLGGAVLV